MNFSEQGLRTSRCTSTLGGSRSIASRKRLSMAKVCSWIRNSILNTDKNTEVLKQPLHTSVAIDIADFNDYNLEEQLKIGISVKDFKAVIIHATTLKAPIMARYSIPRRPMQLSYSDGGLQCEFVFMTSGNSLDASATPRTSVSRTSASEARMRQSPQTLPLHQRRQPNRSPMPPPAWPTSRGAALETASQRTTRPSPPAPRASVNEESLFVGGDDEDDQVWGERTYEEDEGELRWVCHYYEFSSTNCVLTESGFCGHQSRQRHVFSVRQSSHGRQTEVG